MHEIDLTVVDTDVEHVLRGIYHRHRQASAEPSVDLSGTLASAPEFTNIDLPPQLYFQLDHAARIYDPRSVPGHTRFRWLKTLLMRVMRLYTTRQVEFNATVMRVLDIVTDKLHDVVATFQYFRDAEVRLTRRLEQIEQGAGKLCERLDAQRTRIEDLESYERELFAQRTRIEHLEAYERGLYALRTRIENLEAYERDLFALRTRIESLEAYERDLFALRTRIENLEAYERDLFALRTRIENLEAYERDLFALRTRLENLEAYERDLFALRTRIEALEAYERDLFALRTRIEALEAYERDLFALRTRIENLEAYEREILAQRTRFEAVEETGRTVDKRLRVVEDLHNRLEYALSENAVLRKRFDALIGRLSGRRGRAAVVPDTITPAYAVLPTPGTCNDHLYFPYLNLDRGTEDDIRKRLADYLPFYQRVPAGSASEAVVLDVGCGRGEFLDLCRRAGIPCRGLEVNEDMVAHCQAKKHDVVHALANEYLASLDDESLRGIISCHVVEHMSGSDLLTFVKLTAAKVAPGGCIIVETPNPNSVFALKMFYRDFTHVRPVHPDTLQFLYRQMGVQGAEVKMLSPAPKELLLKYCKQRCVDQAFKQLNEFLFGYLDYALIVTK